MLFNTLSIALLASVVTAGAIPKHHRRGYSPVRPNYGAGPQNGTLADPITGSASSSFPVLPSQSIGSFVPDAAIPSGSLVLPGYTQPSTIADSNIGGGSSNATIGQNGTAPLPTVTAGAGSGSPLPVEVIITTTEVVETTTYVYVEGPSSSQVTKTTTLSLTNTRTFTSTRTPAAQTPAPAVPGAGVPGQAADEPTVTRTATRTNIVTIPRPGGAGADSVPTGSPGYGAGGVSPSDTHVSPGATGGGNAGNGGSGGAEVGAGSAIGGCTPVTVVSTTTAVSTVYVTVSATPVAAAGGSAPGTYAPPKDTIADSGANTPPNGAYVPTKPSATATTKDVPSTGTPGLPSNASAVPATSTTADANAGVEPEEDCYDDDTSALPVSRQPSYSVSSAQPSATGSGSYGGYKRADAAWRAPLH